MNTDIALYRLIIKGHPACMQYLSGVARWVARMGGVYPEAAEKTEEAFARQMYNRIRELYSGELDTNGFLDAAAELIQQQLTRAFRAALRDNEMDPNLVNRDGEGFRDELESMILNEYEFVDRLAADVVQAAKDETDVGQFQARAELYANRYNDAYNQAQVIISEQNGDVLEWEFGDTDHCDTCYRLNGIRAYAKEWEALGVFPQQPPNEKLECGGYKCHCKLKKTDQRRSPNAFQMIMDIVTQV